MFQHVRTAWQLAKSFVRVLNELRSNWRIVLKELLVIFLKAFILFQMVFMVAITIANIIQPEQPEYHLQPIFRIVDERLVGYVVRQDLYDNVCNGTQQFVLGSKFPRKEICHLKNEPLPTPKNRHFNLIISATDRRCNSVTVCWMKKNISKEICEQLPVKQGKAVVAHSVDIREVDLIEISMELPHQSAVLDQPELLLILDENRVSLAIRGWFGIVSMLWAASVSGIVSVILVVIEISRLLRHLQTLTKQT